MFDRDPRMLRETPIMIRHLFAAATIVVTMLASPASIEASSAQGVNPLSKLAGSWSGSGTAHFKGGQSERLTCRGHYTVKDGGAGIGIALRCASSSAKIDLRSLLNYQAGRVSGSWEERTFNAAGGVSGRASNGSMRLAIGGSGLSGSMSVSFSDSSQSVSINTSGTDLKVVSISMRRG